MDASFLIFDENEKNSISMQKLIMYSIRNEVILKDYINIDKITYEDGIPKQLKCNFHNDDLTTIEMIGDKTKQAVLEIYTDFLKVEIFHYYIQLVPIITGNNLVINLLLKSKFKNQMSITNHIEKILSQLLVEYFNTHLKIKTNKNLLMNLFVLDFTDTLEFIHLQGEPFTFSPELERRFCLKGASSICFPDIEFQAVNKTDYMIFDFEEMDERGSK